MSVRGHSIKEIGIVHALLILFTVCTCWRDTGDRAYDEGRRFISYGSVVRLYPDKCIVFLIAQLFMFNHHVTISFPT